MKITGNIKLIKQPKQISEKFVKREFILIDDAGMYKQELIMECVQDKVSILDNYANGDRVEVDINILGRMWTSPQGEDKYFVTLQCWRIEKVGLSPEELNDVSNDPVNTSSTEINERAEDDDLPF